MVARTKHREAPPLSPYWRHPAGWLALAVVAACVLVSVSFRQYDYDIWQHLAVGKAIAQLGRIPREQLWTWPDHGAAVVDPSWGFSALIWPWWRAAGEWGWAAWRWTTTLLVFAFLWWTGRTLGARDVKTLFVLVLGALVYRQRSQARPETLAAVLLAAELWLLARRPRTLAGLLPLAPLIGMWANVHLSWVLGTGVLAVHLAGAGWGRARDPARARALGWTLLAALALCFVNPFGWRAVWRPFQYLFEWRHDPLIAGISELAPLDWRLNLSNGLPLLMAGWPALALWSWLRKRPDPVECVLCVSFTGLALSGSRFIGPYVVVAAPYVMRGLDAWLRRRGWATSPRQLWRDAALTGAACVLAGLYEWTHFEDRLGIRVDARRLPVSACDFIAAHGVRGKAINDFYLGGYLLWRFWPDRSRLPFMDIHPEDKSPELRIAYLQAFSSRRGWDRLDQAYRFDWALLSRSHLERLGLLDLLDTRPEWALVFVDDAAALYVRRDGACAALARDAAYTMLPGGSARLASLIAAAARDTSLARDLRSELARQAAGSPSSLSFAQARSVAGP